MRMGHTEGNHRMIIKFPPHITHQLVRWYTVDVPGTAAELPPGGLINYYNIKRHIYQQLLLFDNR